MKKKVTDLLNYKIKKLIKKNGYASTSMLTELERKRIIKKIEEK